VSNWPVSLIIYCIVIFFILGAVMGSFINCMAWRVAHGESVLKGRSHCAVCGHTLSALDLIPVLSYIFLKGRCRYCKKKMSPRYLITEVVMGLLFVICFLRFSLSVQTLRIVVLTCDLLALSLVDLEIYEIPDRFIVFGIVWWAVTQYFIDPSGYLTGIIGGLAIGGSMLLISLLFDHILKKESLGGGDIKLFFMTALYLGAWGGLFSLILSCILGLVMAGILRKQKIPFGPAISAAAYISLLCADGVVSWYLSLLGL